jgi:hypothetical protein
VMSRLTISWVLVYLLARPPLAEAKDGYGAAGGIGLPLSPTEKPGISLGLSAMVVDPVKGPQPLLLVRGEILGLLTNDARAALPTLTGDMGLRAGPVDLFISGGVELFGFAWRADYTLFSTFGLLGGAGMTVRVHEQFQLELRTMVTWLPSFTAGVIKRPEEGDKPSVLFASGLLGFVYCP